MKTGGRGWQQVESPRGVLRSRKSTTGLILVLLLRVITTSFLLKWSVASTTLQWSRTSSSDLRAFQLSGSTTVGVVLDVIGASLHFSVT
jgi:hypothetical protein